MFGRTGRRSGSVLVEPPIVGPAAATSPTITLTADDGSTVSVMIMIGASPQPPAIQVPPVISKVSGP